jgi:2-(1,2-epoxy-1,2-dihydrophenyl)acetyl-CoA isomerase
MGEKRAKAFTLLGEVLDAPMALNIGLINAIVSTDQLNATVQRYTQRLAMAAQPALANSKRLLNASTQHNLEQQLYAEQLSFTECTLSPDFAEGVQAFIAKRKPNFGQ